MILHDMGSIMARELVIDGFKINDGSDCYVIAEIGHNHQGDLEQCKKMFDVAKECGANAVKLQKRDNRTMFTKEMFDSPYLHRNSYAPTYGEHREKLEFTKAQHLELIAHAKKIGITFFSTAFDIPSADFLADLDMPAYKIASGDTINIPLLRHVAKIGKPMIISTGGCTMEDVVRAYRADHADQSAALHPAMHLGLSGRIRRTESEGDPDLPRAFPGCGDRPVRPRQRHRDGDRSPM